MEGKYDVTSEVALRRIIRNVKIAVEQEIGPIEVEKDGNKGINNFPYYTFLELLKGVLFSLPKDFNMKATDSDLPF